MNALSRFTPRALLTHLLPLAHRVSELFARFSPRERRFLGAGGIALGATLVYLLLLDPLWEAYTRLQARVTAKERELSEVIALRQTYQTLRAEVERSRPAITTNFSPVAFLEGLATSTLGRDKVAAINPLERKTESGVAQETIELRLSGVSLHQLTELLYKLDSATVTLRVTRVSIKKQYKNPYTFDVSLTTLALIAQQ